MSQSHSQDFTPNLHHARLLLSELISHIQAFDLDKLMYRAPILDRIRFDHWSQDEIMGYKKWLDGVENHGRLLDAMIDSRIPPKDDPIPTVLNLITYWKIIITSQSPIVGVKMSMGGEKRQAWPQSKSSTILAKPPKDVNGKGKEKEKEVWVDVIAQGGREWIRIYSKKISHLLAEFREADSYVNSDFDSDSDSDTSAGPTPSSSKQTTKTRPGMNNSLVTTAQDLLRAANSVERIPGAPVPSITIHLTRIPASPTDLYRNGPRSDNDEEREEVNWPDDRIPLTFQHLRSQGINLIFGDLSDKSLSSLSGPPLPMEPIPSLRFNLDITALLGLCSDVLHHPLPTSRVEAARRSLRPTGHLLQDANGEIKLVSRGRDGTGKSKNKVKRQPLDSEEEEELKGQSQNSIELYKCILEEMERPFVEEFNEVIEGAWKEQLNRRRNGRSDQPDSFVDTVKDLGAKMMSDLDLKDDMVQPRVEFHTTLQAAQYTYEALSSGPAHGHGMEQRRMRRMLGLEEGDFFEGSRYEGKEGFLRGLKVRIFDLGGGEGFRARSVGEVLEEGRRRGEELRDASLDDFQKSQDRGVVVDGTTDGQQDGVEKTGFHQTLYSITSQFLDQYYLSLMSDITTNNTSSQKNQKITSQTTGNLPNFLQPRKLPTPPIAKISLPFPVVSLHSLERGAKEGMTTIMMGTATLKEVWGQVCWRVRGWERGWYDWEDNARGGGSQEGKKGNDNGMGELDGRREKGHAAIMIFPYRVFGEGKRVRFERGDYSYPTKDWWDDEDSGAGGPQ